MKLKMLPIAVVLAVFVQGIVFAQTNNLDTLNNMGVQYFNQGNYPKAIECFLEAKAIIEKNMGKENPNYASMTNNLGLLYKNMGEYAIAIEYYLETKTVYEKTLGKEHLYYATCLNNLGLLYRTMGDYTNAERYLTEAKNIRENKVGKTHADYANSVNNLGLLYKNMGKYADAERYLLEARAFYEKTYGKESTAYAVTVNNLGTLYNEMGNYAKAKECYLETIAIYEKTVGKEHPSYALSVNNLGGAYIKLGEYANAERCYLETKNIFEKNPGREHPSYATSLNNLGLLYDTIADYDKAELCYLEAKAIFEKALGKENPNYAKTVNNLGGLYFVKGDYTEAEPYMLEAKAIEEKILGKEHPSYAVSLGNLYLLYLSKSEFDKALQFTQEEFNITSGMVNRNFAFLSEQQRNAYWSASLLSFESNYSLSFYNPVPASNILNYDNALFTKGLLLRTNNAVRDAIYASGDQRLIEQFEKLHRLRQQISALMQTEDGDEAVIRNLKNEAEALDKSLTQASAAYRDFQADLAVNWKNVQKCLQKGEAAVEFVSFQLYDKKWTGNIHYAALVLKPDSKAPVWVPLCEESALAELFSKLDGKRTQEQARILYDEYGAAVYNAVWQPLEKELKGVNTVYYSPSGLLHKVAFGAIPVDGKTRLSDKYNLNMVSSTREVVYAKNRIVSKPGSAVVYGGLNYTVDADTMKKEALAYNVQGTQSRGQRDLTFTDDAIDTAEYQKKTSGSATWSYLQFTDTESKGIYQLLTANKIPAVLYNGVKGNKESFKSLNGRKTVVIHLATHGFFNKDTKKNYEARTSQQQSRGGQAFENPLLRSGLILAGANTWAKKPVEGTENGILLAADVAGMNLLGADLIVLSACETALGEVNNSEGVFGLQRAFKLAGAQTLIMSLWKVDDEATSILVNEFYKNWLSGKSKQEAFKAAQKKVRSDSRYISPFYWAAFVMMD